MVAPVVARVKPVLVMPVPEFMVMLPVVLLIENELGRLYAPAEVRRSGLAEALLVMLLPKIIEPVP